MGKCSYYTVTIKRSTSRLAVTCARPFFLLFPLLSHPCLPDPAGIWLGHRGPGHDFSYHLCPCYGGRAARDDRGRRLLGPVSFHQYVQLEQSPLLLFAELFKCPPVPPTAPPPKPHRVMAGPVPSRSSQPWRPSEPACSTIAGWRWAAPARRPTTRRRVGTLVFRCPQAPPQAPPGTYGPLSRSC